MDEAKLTAENLKLRDDVKLLKRQRTSPGAAALVAMQADLDAMQAVHDKRLGELTALQKQHDELREKWISEHGAALVLRAKVEELQPVQVEGVVVDTRPVHVAALTAEVEMLRASQGGVARHLQDDLRALQLTYDALETRERHQGRDLVNVQAAYANLWRAQAFPKPLDTPEDTDEG